MNLSIEAKNKQNLPYNLQSDLVKVKIVIYNDFNHSYLSGIEIKIYGNFDSIEELLGTYYTNEYGIVEFLYNTNNILNKNITTGQIWCKFTYDQNEYISNKTRINFINDETEEILLIILNANTVNTRLVQPDLYINVDANIVSTRLSVPDDYTIYHREF